MAKKKNRKKALKRKQKREMVIDLSQLSEVDQGISASPKIVERRIINMYEKSILAYRQFFEMNPEGDMTQEEVNELGQLINQDDFEFLPPYQKLIKALEASNPARRHQLLTDLLEEPLVAYDAKLQLLLEDADEMGGQYFERLHEFVAETLHLWKQTDYADDRYLLARPYWLAFCFIIDYYLHTGFEFLALELVNEILRHKIDSFTPNFLSVAFATYLVTGQFQKMAHLYQRLLKSDSADRRSLDGPLLYMILADILSNHHDDARKRLDYLFDINEEAAEFLNFEGWIDSILDIESEEGYLFYSADALRAYLLPAFDYLESNTAVQVFLFDYFQNLDFEDEGMFDFSDDIAGTAKVLQMLKLREITSIRLNAAQALSEFGILFPEDFKDYTESEILAIKGIGKATIEKLKKNGIVFKGD